MAADLDLGDLLGAAAIAIARKHLGDSVEFAHRLMEIACRPPLTPDERLHRRRSDRRSIARIAAGRDPGV